MISKRCTIISFVYSAIFEYVSELKVTLATKFCVPISIGYKLGYKRIRVNFVG